MKKWSLMLLLVTLAVVGWGCTSKDSEKGPPVLSSRATPTGRLWENTRLDIGDIEVTLTASFDGAVIYFTSGTNPTTPTTSSPIFDPASPIVIDTSYKDSTFIIKYFAWYQDPVTLEIEQEDPFNTETFYFQEDIFAPIAQIDPHGGTIPDSQAAVITLSAIDTHDTPDLLTIRFTYTVNGTIPMDPRTAPTNMYYENPPPPPTDWIIHDPVHGVNLPPNTGPGDPVGPSWNSGMLKIKVYAIDEAGNESAVVYVTFSVDASSGGETVWGLINLDRDNAGLARLSWNTAWAGACTAHAAGLEAAGNNEFNPDNYDDQNKQLMSFDSDPGTGFHISAAATAMGAQAVGPTAFYETIKSNSTVWNILMNPACTNFGCGCADDTWEMMCTTP